MLRRYPNHSFDELTQINIYISGFWQQPNLLLDSNAGGSIMSKNAEDATIVIERVALNDYQWQLNNNPTQRKNDII